MGVFGSTLYWQVGLLFLFAAAQCRLSVKGKESHPLKHRSKAGSPGLRSSGSGRGYYALPGQSRAGAVTQTVFLRCLEATVEITVLADLYAVGTAISGSDLRLGPPAAPGSCTVASPGGESFVITAELQDCGSELSFTEDLLVYSNTLFYTPAPSPGGIIRMNNASIPLECHYNRMANVSSDALKPTWVPFTSTRSAEDVLDFSLQLMTDDWSSQRPSNVFYLGDMLHLEASVNLTGHLPLRLFVDRCVATLEPNQTSSPSYAFIENHGCFVDSKATGSSSRFLPRPQDSSLRMQLEAFRFHQDARSSLYITCHLTMALASQNDAQNKACSFVQRWQSVDGSDQVCSCCDSSCDPASRARGLRRWSRGAPSPEQGLVQEADAMLGPFFIMGRAPPNTAQ
ncbi:zona pellucida sperm-binding protein 3 [Amia ocellicauda]|uniref:zona pellucida sperm-binding protein 3 n=1 Tax=Amia ocellicauda TaxID=2972642 RepID=UPI003464A213